MINLVEGETLYTFTPYFTETFKKNKNNFKKSFENNVKKQADRMK